MPAIGLAATGEFSYNGYTFDGASRITCDVEFVYDESGRSVAAHRHTIGVTAVVANDGTNNGDLDVDLENIRRRLGEPGKVLKFINKGFGRDLIVNQPGGALDINLGPLPRLLRWAPLGDDKAVEIEWQVVTDIQVCPPGSGQKFTGIKALNYSVDFAIDSRGDTTRTITGYVEIVQSRGINARSVYGNVFLNAFIALPLLGFKRTQARTVNAAKNRLDFTITDTQIPTQNPYYPGVIDMSGTHDVSWGRSPNGMKYANVISATIEPAAEVPSAQAWTIFLRIVKRRYDLARKAGRTPFFQRLEVSEDLFGRAHSFRVSYWFLSCIDKFVGDSGLWTPLGTEWNLWRTSMSRSMFNPRGNRQLVDQVDAVVDLCGPATGITYNNLQTPTGFGTEVSGGIKNDMPSPSESFMDYNLALMSTSRRPVSQQAVIQSPETSDELGAGGFNYDAAGQPVPSRGAEYGELSSEARTDDVVQEGGQRSTRLRVVLNATRAGHEIPRPVIKEVFGASVVERFAVGVQWIAGNWFGVPVYKAKYATDYAVGKTPSKMKPPDDKKECIEGGKAKRPSDPSFETVGR